MDGCVVTDTDLSCLPGWLVVGASRPSNIYVHIRTGTDVRGARRSSGGRTLACKGWGHPIEPAWQVHLQFRLFSVPTSDPQQVHKGSGMCCAYKRSLAAYRKE